MTSSPHSAWLITPYTPDNILSDKSHFAPSDLIIAIDNGLSNCLKHHLNPDILIGDLDSLEPALLKTLPSTCRIIIHPPEKDETDTQLAVEYCIEYKIKQINICNDLSGRFDHALGIIQNLLQIQNAGGKATVYTGSQIIFILDSTTCLSYPPQTLLSLISLSETSVFLSSTGLKYPLDDVMLCSRQSKGISNILTEPDATVEMLSGIVLAIVTLL